MPGVREDIERLYPYEDISLEIARLRGRLEMTQTDFAKLVGMPQSTVARLESGRHNPSVRVLKHLAKATGTELAIEFRRPKRTRRARPDPAATSSAGEPARKPVAASSTRD
jgi:transcriptional regulator with XRE-family HTH domain